ncbi:uncharacterized protein LOC107268590 [Cephus cinctus]|uniref:Uncharacterized protein LOC107268590 n=1 Tax=Cephus cinctus TaxID=211228 RepID=A0AAJ7BXX2_CEPCN|nr:uncharacterized protein LOC107268590 [Cephus cinctus]
MVKNGNFGVAVQQNTWNQKTRNNERPLTEAELKVLGSLKKLSIPDWYLNKKSSPPKILKSDIPIESRPRAWRPNSSFNNMSFNADDSRSNNPILESRNPSGTYKIKRSGEISVARLRKTFEDTEMKQLQLIQYTPPKASNYISKTFPKISPSRKIQNINIIFPSSHSESKTPERVNKNLENSKNSSNRSDYDGNYKNSPEITEKSSGFVSLDEKRSSESTKQSSIQESLSKFKTSRNERRLSIFENTRNTENTSDFTSLLTEEDITNQDSNNSENWNSKFFEILENERESSPVAEKSLDCSSTFSDYSKNYEHPAIASTPLHKNGRRLSTTGRSIKEKLRLFERAETRKSLRHLPSTPPHPCNRRCSTPALPLASSNITLIESPNLPRRQTTSGKSLLIESIERGKKFSSPDEPLHNGNLTSLIASLQSGLKIPSDDRDGNSGNAKSPKLLLVNNGRRLSIAENTENKKKVLILEDPLRIGTAKMLLPNKDGDQEKSIFQMQTPDSKNHSKQFFAMSPNSLKSPQNSKTEKIPFRIILWEKSNIDNEATDNMCQDCRTGYESTNHISDASPITTATYITTVPMIGSASVPGVPTSAERVVRVFRKRFPSNCKIPGDCGTASPGTKFMNSKKKSTTLERIVKSSIRTEKSLVDEVIEGLNEKLCKQTINSNKEAVASRNFVKKLVYALENNKQPTIDGCLPLDDVPEEDGFNTGSDEEVKSESSTSISFKSTDSDTDQTRPIKSPFSELTYDLGHIKPEENDGRKSRTGVIDEDGVYWIPMNRFKLPRTSSLLSMMSRISGNSGPRQSPCMSPIRRMTDDDQSSWGSTYDKKYSTKLLRTNDTRVIDSGYSDRSSAVSSSDRSWLEDVLFTRPVSELAMYRKCSTLKSSSRPRSYVRQRTMII